jgi:hypothetical protein
LGSSYLRLSTWAARSSGSFGFGFLHLGRSPGSLAFDFLHLGSSLSLVAAIFRYWISRFWVARNCLLQLCTLRCLFGKLPHRSTPFAFPSPLTCVREWRGKIVPYCISSGSFGFDLLHLVSSLPRVFR